MPSISTDRSASPSSRRAWIEIFRMLACKIWVRVALLAEGVDRKGSGTTKALMLAQVALRAEGVDRNAIRLTKDGELDASPSSRRAWIEIPYEQCR